LEHVLNVAARTAFEVAWNTIIDHFRLADEVAMTAILDTKAANYDGALEKLRFVSAHAANIAVIWPASRSELWSALDEPLLAYSTAFAATAQATEDDVAFIVSEQRASDLGAATLDRTLKAQASLMDTARKLSISLGGPSDLAELGAARELTEEERKALES
jgi:hypothetical protein